MQNVVTYARISNEKQASGHSLDGQDMLMREFCQRHKMHIVSSFSEVFSAKNHNRPQWRALMEFCRLNSKVIHYVLVANHERFSRNVMTARIEEEELNRLGIRLMYVNQGMVEDTASTTFLNNILISAAEFDNKQRSEKVQRGMRTVLELGGYPNRAPLGYARCWNGKLPTLEPNEDADKVRMLFELTARLGNQQEVLREMRFKYRGFKMAKSYLSRLLRNPIYVGLCVWEHKGERKEVQGLHPGLVSRKLFDTVQHQLDGKRKPTEYRPINEDYPLRGMLVCPHGRLMTASRSKSRHGYYVYYYHCTSTCPDCERVNARDIDEQIVDVLRPIRFSGALLSVAQQMIEAAFKHDRSDLLREVNTVKQRIATLEQKLERIKGDYLADRLDPSTFMELKQQLSADLVALQQREAELERPLVDVSPLQNEALLALDKLDRVYLDGDMPTRRAIVGSIIGEKIRVRNKTLSNPLNPLVSLLFGAKSGEKFSTVARSERIIEPSELNEGIRKLVELAQILAA